MRHGLADFLGRVVLKDLAAAADEKNYLLDSDGAAFVLKLLSDDELSETDLVNVERTAMVANAIEMFTRLVVAASQSLGDTTSVMELTSDGTNSATTLLYVGSRTPEGNVTANPGTFYARVDSGTPGNSTLYIKQSSGASSTGWVDLSAAGVTTYLGLTDTPGSFAANQIHGVNAAANALEAKTLTELAVGSTFAIDATLLGVFIGSDGPGNYGTLTGTRNTMVGDAAGNSLTSGVNNSGYGQLALDSLTDGQNNAAFGRAALHSLIGGDSNTAVGLSSGTGATTGNRNIFLGTGAALKNATDSDVIVIGNFDGSDVGQRIIVDPNLDGVFIGAGDPGNWPVLSGTGNTVVGDGAGAATTSASNSTYVGKGAGSNGTTGGNNLCLGLNTTLPTATAGNHMNIMNMVFGDTSGKDVRVGGSGVVSQAERLAVENDVNDNIEIFSLESTGSNGAKTRFHVGTRDPSATVSAEPGDIYIRVSGVNSGVFNNTGASAGSTWTQL